MRRILSILVLSASLAFSTSALADTPDGFVKSTHTQLTNLLRQPASPTRDDQITKAFEGIVDYSELTKRCFKEHWSSLTPAQQTEITGLVRRLVEKNYKKNLNRTLNYTITYSGAGAQGGDTRVKTEATNNANARETVEVDYIVAGPAGGPFKVVDIYTENSSLTNGYYNSFHKMLTTDGQGYPYIVKKINEKLAQP